MCETHELWQVDLDKPFRLYTDASDTAIGAELQQEIDGEWRPVALFSRKLTGSQNNWSTREKETYAIVAALRKWHEYIGFQPVEVRSDHRSLENWITEHIDTPSGPRGRRARWHETFSQFDLTINYVPGPDNTIADAMSRYPATCARQDISVHGDLEAKEEVKRMEQEEKQPMTLKSITLVRRQTDTAQIRVTTRRGTAYSTPEDTEETEEEPEPIPRLTRSQTRTHSPPPQRDITPTRPRPRETIPSPHPTGPTTFTFAKPKVQRMEPEQDSEPPIPEDFDEFSN